MSAELYADDTTGRPVPALEATGDVARRRPNVAGDLPTVFQVAPMFRRAVAGYDRFQVDTYVQWAEDELASADREREHLVARLLRTRAALVEARQLLTHSAGGAELLGLSRRMGSMLAAAADEAEGMRAEADAERSAAAAQAERMVAKAEQVVADADAEAARLLAEVATEASEMAAEAGRIVDEAEQTGREARAEAEARLEKVLVIEQRAADDVVRIRHQAIEEAAAARLQARDELVRMLSTGRDERRRADAEAAETRDRLDREASTRRAALLVEVAALEDRRSSLLAEVELLARPVAEPTGGRLEFYLGRILDRLRWWSRSLRAP